MLFERNIVTVLVYGQYFDETPQFADNSQEAKRKHCDQKLCNTASGALGIEIVNTKPAEEYCQDDVGESALRRIGI